MQEQSINDMDTYIHELAVGARLTSGFVAHSTTRERNRALTVAAEQIVMSAAKIQKSNMLDMNAARQAGLSDAMLDRLELTPERIERMAEGLRQIAELSDPIYEITDLAMRPSGIQVGRMRVPIGVIAIIYESRPSVTAEAGGLCLKAGNAVILRGGSEAFHSNQAIAACLHHGLKETGIGPAAIQLIGTTERSAIDALVKLNNYVDLIIPRGGKELIERITSQSKIPVIKHLDGVCHVYVDGKAHMHKAAHIVMNSKTQRFGVCNAAETLLVAESVANKFLPMIVPRLQEHGVELRGCEVCCEMFPQMVPAAEDDWYEEYLAPILAVRVVDGVDEAISHIYTYGSGHTDCIVTEDLTCANRFLRKVNSSSVMVNASTRFADGFEYGLGAEIGISTDKLHARGPVGLEGLTMQKYIVYGNGHTRN